MRKVNLVLILMLIAAARTARADIIYVSGDQTGTWSADTVMVTGEVRVPPGETLVIEPGVKVLFQVYCKFIVDSAATLSAVGRMTMPIYFDDFIDGAKWHGIRFIHASAATRVEFCHFRHGYGSGSSSDAYGGAIYCYGSDITIRNCIIDSCSAQKGGAIAVEFSAGELSRNIIRKNTNWGGNNQGCGIYCNNANPVICQNLISENGYAPAQGGGLYCLNSSPIIAGNLFVEIEPENA